MEIVRDNGTITQYRYYQWDSDGKPLGFIIREKNASGEWVDHPYYYWTNQRGDVISILDSSGNEVGSYLYDAYGNVLSENGAIAKENPIRYAGYYYDNETKHYYLKARYYNPQNGNFLALDPHPGDKDDPISQNGYIYAGNNPVMNIDPTGFYWKNHWWNSRWFVSNAINWAIQGVIGGGLLKLSAYLRNLSKKYSVERAKIIFSRSLKRKLLALGLSTRIASYVVNAVNAVFSILMWYSNPGEKIFNYLDSRDKRKNNGFLNY